MSFFKQRGMLLVRLFEAIYPSHLTVAIANIHKIKMGKTQLRDFFTIKETGSNTNLVLSNTIKHAKFRISPHFQLLYSMIMSIASPLCIGSVKHKITIQILL